MTFECAKWQSRFKNNDASTLLNLDTIDVDGNPEVAV